MFLQPPAAHGDTPEEEAATSMRLANRLLSRNNLEQADVMDGADQTPESLKGGSARVHIRRVAGADLCKLGEAIEYMASQRCAHERLK